MRDPANVQTISDIGLDELIAKMCTLLNVERGEGELIKLVLAMFPHVVFPIAPVPLLPVQSGPIPKWTVEAQAILLVDVHNETSQEVSLDEAIGRLEQSEPWVALGLGDFALRKAFHRAQKSTAATELVPGFDRLRIKLGPDLWRSRSARVIEGMTEVQRQVRKAIHEENRKRKAQNRKLKPT